MLVLARCSASNSRLPQLSRCLSSTPPTAGRYKRSNDHKVMQGMRGLRDLDHKKLPSRHRLASSTGAKRHIHPDLLPKSRNPYRAPPIAPFQHPTARVNPLVVGATSVISTPRTPGSPRVAPPKPARHPAQNQHTLKADTVATVKQSKKEALKNFTFRPEPLQRKPPVASKFTNHPTLVSLPTIFSSPPLREDIHLALKEYLCTKDGQPAIPTPIQRLVLGNFLPAPRVHPVTGQPLKLTDEDLQSDEVPRMMRPSSKTLLAAETGSGKTLAYVLPVIQTLKDDEDRRVAAGEVINDRSVRSDNSLPRLRPRALVLVPTHELARQVAAMFKIMTHRARLRVACLSAGSGSGPESGVRAFDPETDIVVGTISKVKELLGMTTRIDEAMDERRTKKQEEEIKAFIAKYKESKKVMDEGKLGWKEKETEGWHPNPNLTWAENWEAKKAQDEADKVEKELAKGDPGDDTKPEIDNLEKLGERKFERKTHLGLDRLQWLVIDEADVVLNVDFINDTLPIINPVLKAKVAPRFLLATATIPESLTNLLATHYPTMTRLITPNLHRLPSTLSIGKVGWSGGNWRADILLEIRRAFVEDARNGHENSQIIVFINKNVKAEDFGRYLEEFNVPSVTLTGDSRIRGRGHSRAILPFLKVPKFQSSYPKGKKKEEQDEDEELALPPVEYKKPPPGPRVLVTTGLLSRGVDFSPNVKTVIITDEPRNAVDFIHRAGRAGRAGAGGRVIIFSDSGEPQRHRLGGGKGRGGAIYKTIQAAKARFEGRGSGSHKSGKRRHI